MENVAQALIDNSGAIADQSSLLRIQELSPQRSVHSEYDREAIRNFAASWAPNFSIGHTSPSSPRSQGIVR
jgi:hypothetical protein